MLVIVLVAAGCTQDVDPEWQLDHDRVIAVRASPPRINAGQQSIIDALLGREGMAPFTADPETATVVSPTSLASTLSQPAQQWLVTAPSNEQLAAARVELGLEPGAPVPLRIRVTFTLDQSATKVVWLGELTSNPTLDPVLVDGQNAVTMTELVVGKAVDVPLSVEFDEETTNVNWLTSCGSMHDFDLPQAYLRVEPEDPQVGSLAVVVRDDQGGTSWRVWSISAQ